MKQRRLGGTELHVSELGFGCGMVGGLLTYGEYPVMRQTVARAIELGVSYFDTAPMYGEGQSEVNLGAILRELGAAVVVGTKVWLEPADMPRLAGRIPASLEASLRRLGMEQVHLVQLHNPLAVGRQPEPGWIPVDRLPEVCAIFESLARQGKARHWGITGLGEAEALHRAVSAGGFHSMQVVYNLLNPSAGRPVPAGSPYPDYGQILDRAAAAGIGTIAIRTLAGGALSGATVRHPVAAPTVRPLVTGPHYAADVAASGHFGFLVREGIVDSLVEAALRFAISKPELSVAMLGISSPEQLEVAVNAVNRGPLPADVLGRL